MTGSPDPTRYAELIERLLDLQRREPSHDALTASYEALGVVVDFLNADNRLWKIEAARPLARLHLSLLDLKRGSKPKLFFDQQKPKAKGAPIYTSATILRAFVNAAFLTLCSGLSEQEASRWLAAELKRAGIQRPNGKAICAPMIVRWCLERGGKSLKGSDELLQELGFPVMRSLQELRRLRGKYAQDHSDYMPPIPQAAKIAAAGIIELLKLAGF